MGTSFDTLDAFLKYVDDPSGEVHTDDFTRKKRSSWAATPTIRLSQLQYIHTAYAI